jgi:beta-lactamase regulating signal transducer with metallopeptidase domain
MMEFFYDLFGIYGPEFVGPTTLPYSILVGLLKLSLPAGILIAAVLLARQLLRKAPKWISCALWALVALRLICPFTIESPLSVMPNDVGSGKAVDAWMDSYVPGGYTVIYEGEPGYVEAVGSERLPVQSKDGINYVVTGVGVSSVPETVGNQILPYLFCGWVFGMTAMLLYAAVSYLRLKRRTAVTVPWAEGVLMCDEIDAPFILGVFRPRIYLPSRMTEPQLSRVLAHEKAHLKRHDHWWKPLGFLLLSVYWFNPLVWIAYILLCRDIEMACDERVVRDMGTAERADYAQALLDCSRSRRVIAACPLAFGEVGVKERVKGVLNYKKPAFWIILIAIIACIVLAVCLMTDPFSNKSLSGKLGVSMDMSVAEHNRS